MTLIKLYAIALCVMRPGSTLIIDDPDLHVALAEVQPWLLTLVDRSDDIDAQVILSSHHPELINYLAREHGVFFDREHNGPVRVKYANLDDRALPPAELVARGWVDG
jgi:predicted ATPase